MNIVVGSTAIIYLDRLTTKCLEAKTYDGLHGAISSRVMTS